MMYALKNKDFKGLFFDKQELSQAQKLYTDSEVSEGENVKELVAFLGPHKGKVYAVKSGVINGIYFSWKDCQSFVNNVQSALYKSFAKIEEAIEYMSSEKVPVKATASQKEMPAKSAKKASPAKVIGSADDVKRYAELIKEYTDIAEDIAEKEKEERLIQNEISAMKKQGTILLKEIAELHKVLFDVTQASQAIESPLEASNLPVSDEKQAQECDCFAYVDGSYNTSTKVYGYGVVLFIDGETQEYSGCGDDREMASMHNVAGEILGAMEAVEKAIDAGKTSICIYHDYEGIARWAKGEWKRNKVETVAYYEFMQEAQKRISIVFEKVKAHSGVQHNERADELARIGAGIDEASEMPNH